MPSFVFLLLGLTSMLAFDSLAGVQDWKSISARKVLDVHTAEEFLACTLHYHRKEPSTLPTDALAVARFLNQHMPLQTAVASLSDAKLAEFGLTRKSRYEIDAQAPDQKVDWIALANAFEPEDLCPTSVANGDDALVRPAPAPAQTLSGGLSSRVSSIPPTLP